MGRYEKLLQRAVESPGNLRFTDLCKLAEMAGFVLTEPPDRIGYTNTPLV